MIGGLLEIIVALAGIGTAVVLFPMLKKQNEGLALGLVASRVLEAATIFFGVAFLLTIVTLRRDHAGAGCSSPARARRPVRPHLPAGPKLHARGERPTARLAALPVSPGAPRPSRLGIIGALVLFAGYLAVMLGLIGQRPLAGVSALLVTIFEFSLGVWLVVKGFDPEAVTPSTK